MATSITFMIPTGTDDGRTQRDGATYPPNGTITTTIETSGVAIARYDNGSGKNSSVSVQNGLFRWDTSALPDDAIISSATVTFYMDTIANDESRSLTADWYTSWPIDESDWILEPQTGALSGIALSTFSVGSNTITLENVSTNVSTTGYTGLRFHISGGLPTGQNFVTVTAYDNGGEGSQVRASLTVTYTTPSLAGGSNRSTLRYTIMKAAKSGGVAENPIAKAAAEEQKRKEEWNASQLQSIPSETSKAFTLNQNRKTSEAQRRKALTLKTPERKGKINPSTHASSTLSPAQEKVCKRVEKRFENSPDALIKVLKRLEQRFGEPCPVSTKQSEPTR